ncbi:bpX6 domain-containing protein [Undibacterium sp. Ji49W]|uniref:bpX6 domain-containing protein n=1 Tax=Undibacterium sp. Ji49W TaxID=3413040 RepID=UPI003BF15D05
MLSNTENKMQAKVQRPVFEGTQHIRGLWFDLGMMSDAEGKRRVLHAWRAGSRLYQIFDGYFLEFPQALRTHCATLNGLAICDVNGILSSAPLSTEERRQVKPGGFCLVRGAQIHTQNLTTAKKIDPALWLDLSKLPLLVPMEFPQERQTGAEMEVKPGKTLRDILGKDSPEATAHVQGFLDEEKNFTKPGNSKKLDVKQALLAGARAMARDSAEKAMGWVARMLQRRQVSGDGEVQVPGRSSAPSAFEQKLNDMLSKAAVMTGVSKILSQRQANYLRKMLDMFDQGDLMEALRHAIPLSKLDTLGGKPSKQAFSVPRRRDSFAIFGNSGQNGRINIADPLELHLRKTYRQTFERLDREGKIDEAVFVLAELLRAGGEAVDYLEKKGRIRQAAELAETLNLAPEIMIRLWTLAGDSKRAIQIAGMYNAFAEAIKLLEKKHAGTANDLRLHWAQYLAARGDLCEAAEAIWPLAEHRMQAMSWLLQAEQAGGFISLRALVRKLCLYPEGLADSAFMIQDLLYQQDDDGIIQRSRLAMELIQQKNHSQASRRVATALLPHIIAEKQADQSSLTAVEIRQLHQLASSDVLKADLPELKFSGQEMRTSSFVARTSPLELKLQDKGLATIHDAVHLPGGDYLLALGESGVIQINRRGRQLMHFPVPAHHLVIADNGLRALALARRDTVKRISTLDLVGHQVIDWLSLPLSFWSDRYDGINWNIVMHNKLLAVDTSSTHLTTHWQVADLPGKIIAFVETVNAQTMLIATERELEQWRYLLPKRQLNQRDAWAVPDSDVWKVFPVAISEEPLRLYLMFAKDITSLVVRKFGTSSQHQFTLGKLDSEPEVELKDGYLFVKLFSADETRIMIIHATLNQILANISLSKAVQAHIHVQLNHILIFDQCGKLIDIDRQTGQVHSMTVS